jgi:anthranilate synthase/aminodeoxychorismate synthase-like glutamine amidotransferase
MILLIDNYDSFVFNLVRYLRELGQETVVVRNDRLDLNDVEAGRPGDRPLQAAVLSPGPCGPDSAGVCIEFVRRFCDEIPMLGVCLGHQAIAAAFGGRVVRAAEPVHGRTSPVEHDGSELFAGLANPLTAARYHSLVVDEGSLPAELTVTARTPDGIPMALQHRELPIFGVQFHPESVLTEGGHALLRNFLQFAGTATSAQGPAIATEYVPEIFPPTAVPSAPLHW